MELVMKVSFGDLNKVKDILLKDNEISKLSIRFREGKDFGIEGYIIYISGPEELCKKAKEKVKDLVEHVDNEEEIVRKIKEEENRAIEGFGNLF